MAISELLTTGGAKRAHLETRDRLVNEAFNLLPVVASTSRKLLERDHEVCLQSLRREKGSELGAEVASRALLTLTQARVTVSDKTPDSS